ncbi:hypothetical protein ACIQD3_02800 [Peribacillus loiseleuriae]
MIYISELEVEIKKKSTGLQLKRSGQAWIQSFKMVVEEALKG